MGHIETVFATVCWVDLRNYTGYTTIHGQEKTLLEIEKYYYLINEIVEKHNGKLIICLGDGVQSMFTGEHHADDAVQMAEELIQRINVNKEIEFPSGIGIDTGEVGILTIDKSRYPISDYLYGGKTIIYSYRMGNHNSKVGYEILISEETKKHSTVVQGYDIVETELKGYKGRQVLYGKNVAEIH